MNDKERFEQLRENEIKRLTDSLGSKDPVKGILTDDEILKYAGNSVSAAQIRLKRGIGSQSDKSLVNDDFWGVEIFAWMVIMPCTGVVAFLWDIFVAKILFVLFLIILIGYPIYFLYIKDYTEPQYIQTHIPKEKQSSEFKISSNDDLFLLFESKEQIAREMIEKKFPAPQITNTKFNGVLDKCKEVVESQIEILNSITPTEKTKYEIDSRKKLIKQVISKIDDLTNELILSEESKLEEVIDEMDQLIGTVKDY